MASSLFDFTLDELTNRRGRKWHRYAEDIIPMWIADTDYRVASEIKDALIQSVQDEDLHYSDNQGLLEEIVEKITRVNKVPVEKDGIYFTQGVIPAMWLACDYACKPGEEVIVTNPMYFPFFKAAETTGAKMVLWPLSESEGYRFDIERLKEEITPKTKLIFLCNPHNPTGRVMTRTELSAIADLAVDHELIVASDELWEDIVYEGHSHISIASLGPEISNRTLTFFGFSKAYNISGLQIGYASTTNKDMMKGMKKRSQGVFRGITTVSKAVARLILAGDVDYYLREELKHLHRARDYSLKRLSEIEGVECNNLEGTYLLFPNLSDFGKTSTELVEYLLTNARVGVTDGARFGSNGEGHIRINIGTSIHILMEAFNRIEKSLKLIS